VEDTRPKLTIPELVRSSPVPVADSTIRRAVREKRLPAEFIFGKYRIAADDFQKFLRGKAIGTPRTERE
jgi:excisionase family DNA binding protein